MRLGCSGILDWALLALGLSLAIAVTIHVEHCEPLWLGKTAAAILWLAVGWGLEEHVSSHFDAAARESVPAKKESSGKSVECARRN